MAFLSVARSKTRTRKHVFTLCNPHLRKATDRPVSRKRLHDNVMTGTQLLSGDLTYSYPKYIPSRHNTQNTKCAIEFRVTLQVAYTLHTAYRRADKSMPACREYKVHMRSHESKVRRRGKDTSPLLATSHATSKVKRKGSATSLTRLSPRERRSNGCCSVVIFNRIYAPAARDSLLLQP